jgi:thioredoxin-like negative regulator of GroEL
MHVAVLLAAAAAANGIATSGDLAASPLLHPTAARTLRATAADLFGIADNLNRAGRADDAERVLDLLSQHPNPDVRNEARFRRAKLLQSNGKRTDAALLLRQILDEKPRAAPVRLQLAQLLQELGDLDGALRELRAAQASGLPPSVARIVSRYSEALRAQRPFGASFEVSFAPDSNINHATQSDTLGTVFGDFKIDDASKEKSGTGLSLHGQAYRRFRLGGDTSLLARLNAMASLYSKRKFNDVAIDAALGPELVLGSNRLNVEAGATQRWFGQKAFMRSARLGATWTRQLGSLTQLQLNATAALVDNRINDLEDGKTYSGRIAVERALSATTGIGASFSLERRALKDPGYSTTGWQAGLLGWHDLGRMTFTAAAEIGRLKADERLQLFPDARSDRYTRLSFGTTLRRLHWHGFAPLARFSIERNRSTIALYDYRRTRTELGIARAF